MSTKESMVSSEKAKREIVVGLDIGTTKIAAIVGEKAELGKINILGVGHIETRDTMQRGMVINIDKTVDAIIYAVEEASRKSNVNINVAYVGVAGQSIRCDQHRGQITRNNSEDEITRIDVDRLINDMQKVVLDPGEEIIHIIPQDYIVDNERGITEPIGMVGVRLEGNFHIITGQTTTMKNISRCVTKANLEVADMILEPIASSEAVLSDEEKEAGVALIDIGGGTTDIAIFKDKILRHTAVIPLGGEVITNDIKEGCNVMTKQAEKLKIQFGSALANETTESDVVVIPGFRDRPPREISLKNLAFIIQSRVEEIMEHVYYEIKSSGFEKKLQGGIVLTGGGSQLKHLPQLVEYVTGIDARLGFPTEHLAKGLINEVRSPMYSTAIGLVLWGFKNNIGVEKNTPVENKEEPRRWYDKFFKKTKEWLQDDQEDFKN